MAKEIYTISELAELGYPKSKVRQMCRSRYKHQITLSRENDSCTFYIRKSMLDKYWRFVFSD